MECRAKGHAYRAFGSPLQTKAFSSCTGLAAGQALHGPDPGEDSMEDSILAVGEHVGGADSIVRQGSERLASTQDMFQLTSGHVLLGSSS